MNERDQLEQAITAMRAAITHLETQRAILGDDIVQAALAPLQEKLAELERAEAPTLHMEGDRKQVTIMFADILGFTALAENQGPEAVRDLMNACFDQLVPVIEKHGGTVDKFIGNEIMALFGAPISHEDDPERALRAALEMQETLALFSVERGTGLGLRIGINTGLVIAGGIGTHALQEYSVMGDAVNLAKRLEQAAQNGEILISDTYRYVRGVFEVQPLQNIQVKGRREPIQVYRVEREKPRAFRLTTRGVEGIETRMIGREEELARLQQALYQTMEQGLRHMITVVGEAGVGKSRMLYEFTHWMELLPEQIRYFRGRAEQARQNIPYALIRDLFAFRFQIQDSDTVQVVRQKMEVGIGQVLGIDEAGQMRAHFIGQLIGFDFGSSPYLQSIVQGRGIDPQQLRNRALSYITAFFKATAAQRPTVILLEDVHWADDSSLDAILHLARSVADQAVLLVCLARPTLLERRPAWGEKVTGHNRLTLPPLSRQDSHLLVEEILQELEQVPEALHELVVSKTEGNPYYVEELIKMLIEDGVITRGKAGGPWQVETNRLTNVRVPATLTGILQARLDSLPIEERAILQQASVVGRTFWDSAVDRINRSTHSGAGHLAIAALPGQEKLAGDSATTQRVSNALAVIENKEMVFRRDSSAFAGTQEYIFKHAILREATYESVLKRLRHIYHGLVADWLIEHSGDRAGEYTGLIAEHLELAGRTEQAAHYLQQAGEQAARQFANTESVSYLGRALELLPETDSPERTGQRYTLLLAREQVYDVLGEREAQLEDLVALEALLDTREATTVQQSAIRLTEVGLQQAEIALRRGNYARITSAFPEAIAADRKAIQIAQSVQTIVDIRQAREIADSEMAQFDTVRLEAIRLQATGYLQWGQGLWRQGDWANAQLQLEQSLALSQDAGSRQLEADSLRILGNVYYYQGNYAQAKVYWEPSLRISQEIGDRRGESSTLGNLGEGARSQGDYTTARQCYEQRLQISREIGDRSGENLALMNLSLTSHNLGDDNTARIYAVETVQIALEIGNRSHQGYALTNLGHALTGQGQLEQAAERYRRAIVLRRELGEHFLVMESRAGLARVLLAQGDQTQAMSQVKEILLYLEDNSLDGTEEPLRVYLTCYRVLQATGDPRARDILSTAYRLLQARATRIPDKETRRLFLHNVSAHREIQQAFTKNGAKKGLFSVGHD